ncbi:unnamed protein product [Ectocarpus sp. 12 AP-2014]
MTAHTGLWRTVACVLFFQDALSGALFLPVLPSLVGQLLGMEGDTVGFVTAWVVAVLLASYYVGRSGTLTAALRLCSSRSSRAPAAIPPSLLTVGVLLVLSASAYAGCGVVVVVVDHEQQLTTSRVYVLFCFCLLRALTGALAAGHRMSAWRCLHHAALLESAPTTTTTAAKLGSRPWQESAGAVGGLVAGCILAGGLFEYSDPSRPTLLMCLAAAAAHTAALPPVLFVAWRNCCSSRSGTIDGGGGYSTVQGTPGGSDAEVELMGRPPWSARDDSFDGGRGDSAAAAGTPGAGSMERVVDVPGRYLRGCAGDPVEAERRWRLTLEWRAKERIDEVLREPQPHFELIKRHYPHYIHRRARNGCPVWIELPGRIDLPAIRSAGVSPEALQRHYVFVTEYMWGVLEPDFENGQAVTVLDVQGLGMRDLAGEALGFVKQATAIVQDHYVERSNRMFIVNAPSYFSLIWRVIRPMLNERTQAKIGIINTDSKKIAAALLECIAPENLPRQYGGTCPLDLGESEEETDLRAYVASIDTAAAAGPGSHAGAPPPTPPSGLEALRSNEEEEEEVEVDFRARSEPTTRAGGVGPRNNGLPPAAAAGAVTKGRGLAESDVLGGAGAGLKEPGDGGLVAAGRPSGAARRVLGSVRGALGWAGGKLAWRRSTVAHLGQENGFQYDSEQHRWVLQDEMAGGSGGKAGAVEGGGASERGGERVGQTTSTRRERGASISSEDMTVLAIQAAHHSLAEAGLKLSPVPSESPAVLGSSSGVAADRDDGGLPSRLSHGGKHGTFPGGVAAGEDHHYYCYPQPVSSLGVPCPCLRPLGRRASRPNVATVLYASSAAVREALPVWLLARVEAGGLGALPPLVGLVFAAGALVAAAGRGASGCCCGAQYPGETGVGGGGGGRAGRRLLYAVWARLTSVVVLGAVYLLPRIVPEAVAEAFIPPAVLWLAVAAVVAANHASLELCTAAAAAAATAAAVGAASAASSTAGSRHPRPMFVSRTASSSSHGPNDERTRSTSSASCGSGFVGASRGPRARGLSLATASGSNLFVGDVLGSIAGPLVLALAMWAGRRSPLEPSLWLALCLCGDLWLVAGAREAEARHATLLGGGEEEDEEEEERRRSRRFAQFV